MPQPLKILIVENSSADAELLVRELRRTGFEPEWQRVDTEAAYLEHLHAGLDLVLSDYLMPQFSGLRALELLNQSRQEVPLIIVSGTIGEDAAVAAMKRGATDYLLKDRLTRFGSAVNRALESSHRHAEHRSDAAHLLHDELERRVKQRTAELDHANQALRIEIVEHSRTEAALRESEERFRQLAETITNVFSILDPIAGKILYVSPAYERIWGRSGESLLANPRSWFEAICAEDQARVKALVFDRPITNPYDHTYRITQPGGALRWIRDRGYPVRNAAGQIYRVVGIAEDITDHHNLEEQFRQAQKMEAIDPTARDAVNAPRLGSV